MVAPVGLAAIVGLKFLRQRGEHIICRQRPPYPLQRKLTHRLDVHGILDLHQHPRTDEDLSWLGFIAEARGDIGHCADGGIVEASFKADGAERSEAVRDADAKANVMAKGQFSINHA